MASQPLVGPEGPRERWIGPILSESLALLLTAACGVVVVTLLVFAPRIFADSRSLTLSGLQSYFELVRAYLFQRLAGDLGRTQSRQSAGRELLIALRHSLELLAVSMAVALPLGLGWGALLANVRRRLPALLLFGLNTLALSLPS